MGQVFGLNIISVGKNVFRNFNEQHSHETTPQAWGPLITPQNTPHKAMAPQAMAPQAAIYPSLPLSPIITPLIHLKSGKNSK